MIAPTIDSIPDLERLSNAFDQAWQEASEVDLSAFLPPLNHSHFERIASELICIDMEMRWSLGTQKSISDYRSEYPHLFNNPAVVQELAYEDYRQRVQAGEPIQPQEYRDRYAVDVSAWPQPSGTSSSPQDIRTQVISPQPITHEEARTPGMRAAIVEALRESAPRDAERLDEAFGQMPKRGDRVFGFELTEELGEGAFAKVFLALQSELADRPVALKVAVSLNDEPRKLARLQHTNIVPVYSTHHGDGLHAVCMPYLGSLTLDHLLKSMSTRPGSLPKSGRELLSTLYDKQSTTVENRSDSLPGQISPKTSAESSVATPILDMMVRYSHVEAVLWMGARVADGLAHAHERGILHLDLKPANILLTDDGQPMLLDFNLSIDLNNLDSFQAVRLGGTLPFMSPEQLEAFAGGQRHLDERSDLYSLGLILFEFLTGKSPYPRRTGRMKEVVQEQIDDRRQKPPSLRLLNPAITPAVEAIVQKLLDPERTRRYQSASQLREDLERQLSDLPLKYAPDRSVPERVRKWQRRNPRLAIACAVALVAGVFVLMPATMIAVRLNQIAQRKMQLETIEAKQLWQQAIEEAQMLQVILATRTGERAQLDEGIERGKVVLEKYGIGQNADWMKQPLFARLSESEQNQLRLDIGEMLLFMARGEEIRASDSLESQRQLGYESALHWNVLAVNCYPPDRLPKKLINQRTELLELLALNSDDLAIPERPGGASAEYDAYYDGVDFAIDGRYREGLELLIPFTDAHPSHYESWFARGKCHENLGEYKDAAHCWTVCISHSPDLKFAHFNRGLARLKDSDYASANRDFTKELELQPGLVDALINRAIARKGLKDYRGAIADLDAVIAKPCNSVRVRCLRSEINDLDKKLEDAKVDREQAKKMQPLDELDWSTRGYARMTTEPEAALKDLDEAIALNPRSSDALINKSIVLSEFLNRPHDAIAVFDKFLDYYPDHIGVRLGRGVVLARVGECKKARLDVEECRKQKLTPFFLFQAAGIYAQISRHERGTDAKQEALVLLGNSLRHGFSDLELFQTDTDLNPIRDDEEFKRLLQIAAGLKKSGTR